MEELEKKELTDDFIQHVNQLVDELNATESSNRSFAKLVRKAKTGISNRAFKDFKYVAKNYYLTMGLAIGMSVFGIPIGVMFSTALNNFAFIGLGLPIGMSIGMAIGAGLDKKAESDGKQLDLKFSI